MGDILSFGVDVDVSEIIGMVQAGNDYLGAEVGMHMNKVGAKHLTRAKRDLAARWNVPINLVGKLLKLTKAAKWKYGKTQRTSTRHKISFRLLLRPIPAAKLGNVAAVLGGSSRGRGIRAGNRTYPGAFYAQGRGGKWMVFSRRPGESRKREAPKYSELPIDAMKIPESKERMKTDGALVLQRRIDDAAQEIWDTIPREIARRMRLASGLTKEGHYTAGAPIRARRRTGTVYGGYGI